MPSSPIRKTADIALGGESLRTRRNAIVLPSGKTITASNSDNYFGAYPNVVFVKTTNGTDNDSGPGPTVAVGSTVTWGYTVTNTGNVLLSIVTLGFFRPFARRRTAQYFYSHTDIAGSPLEFTAQQRKMVIGFLVLTLSHFIPLVYFGFLVSVAMLGGLAGNLVLLPLLMRPTHLRDSARAR